MSMHAPSSVHAGAGVDLRTSETASAFIALFYLESNADDAAEGPILLRIL
jgi:hypothetical protein